MSWCIMRASLVGPSTLTRRRSSSGNAGIFMMASRAARCASVSSAVPPRSRLSADRPSTREAPFVVLGRLVTIRPAFIEDSGPFAGVFRHGKAADAHAATRPVLGIVAKFFSVECSLLPAVVVLSHRERKRSGITWSLPFWCGPGDERRGELPTYHPQITRPRTYVLDAKSSPPL